MAKVTVITATTGNPILRKCLESVAMQNHLDVQHLILIDGPTAKNKVQALLAPDEISSRHIDIINLPYPIGQDRWNGHRIYAAGTFMAEGDYVMFLDDDNYIDSDHITDCLKVIDAGNDWAYSFRKIVDKAGKVICNDDCESLGKWPSILDQEDYFIDVNCYFLPISIAVQLTPQWYRKAREQGQIEVDRAMAYELRKSGLKFDSTFRYSVNYTVGSTPISVQAEFFLSGNERMKNKNNGKNPWQMNIPNENLDSLASSAILL